MKVACCCVHTLCCTAALLSEAWQPRCACVCGCPPFQIKAAGHQTQQSCRVAGHAAMTACCCGRPTAALPVLLSALAGRGVLCHWAVAADTKGSCGWMVASGMLLVCAPLLIAGVLVSCVHAYIACPKTWDMPGT